MINFNLANSRFTALVGMGILGLTFSYAAEARNMTISGSPATTSVSGRAYAFTPATSGNPGRQMTFTIANKPAWAAFNKYNGTLSGTPKAANVGTYSRVIVSVTDGSSRASLPAFTLTVSNSATTPTGNRAPTISGAPLTTINSGQAYNFVPRAQDADGNSLRFSIASKPAWASFDTTNGRLWGVPTRAQAGSYEEIQIGVTDGKSTARLAQFSVEVVAGNQEMRTVSLSWQAPMQNTDGTTLTNLSGYRVLYGTSKGQYTKSVKLTNSSLSRYVVENLPAGQYYFAIVAVNSAGAESDPSREVGADLS